MEMKEYRELSGRTAAEGIDREQFQTDVEMVREMNALDLYGAMADAMKRSLFYSDDIFQRIEKQRERIKNSAMSIEEKLETLSLDTVGTNYIHAALGIASEAGEMFEEFVKAALENRELNKQNLIEEAGDVLWYVAMLLRELDVSFEEVAERNIAKLQKRFPEKFTKDNAINRDLDEEQKALAG